MKIECVRCGRTGEVAQAEQPHLQRIPDGWEGNPAEAICPGCQFAEWHPHCTSWLDRDDNRVAWKGREGNLVIAPAIAAMPPEEWDTDSWSECDYIDLAVSWIEGEDFPKEWTCPECGGTDFEGVHRDYTASGLKGSSFTVEEE